MEPVRVALDVMGGDNAPVEPVRGAIDALKKEDRLHVILVGDETEITKILGETDGAKEVKDRYEILPSTEVIETAEHPVQAITHKKNSSMVLAMKAVKEGKADAFVSAGNSGAVLVGGQTLIGRIRGVKRAPFAPLIPTEKGPKLLIDSGASVDAKPEYLVQYARMGSIYMKGVLGIENPRVAIVNIGAEEEKGNQLVKETFPLLKECEDINFIGSIEAREIPSGYADVIVCDAFVGNIILKLFEGVGKTFMKLMKEAFLSNFRSKIGALLVMPALKTKLKTFDVKQYGGAPMLGLKGLVVKTHGSAKANEFSNTLRQCLTFHDQKIGETIEEALKAR
ncbi:MAG: phosphate acyltransferase PlsX [Lachnospiraceae bacterium]|jgi:glycerol-3-phosphate acyltransferase PlsX|nr:phosphate acyltransferase PlsX [Lachnospiraceae bacterium]